MIDLATPVPQNFLSRNRRSIAWAIMALVIGIVASFLPRGFDYVHLFEPHFILSWYQPWTDGLSYLLTWPILVSLTIMALVIAVQRNGGSIGTIALVVISWPTAWVFLDGQLEGLVLLGLMLLPFSMPVLLIERFRNRSRRWWLIALIVAVGSMLSAAIIYRFEGPAYYHDVSDVLGTQPVVGIAMAALLPWVVPLVLLKPQIAMFALFAKKQWLITGVLWVGISFVAWGFWPPNLIGRIGTDIKSLQPQDISLFPYSLLLALPLLWFSRGDPEMLMAAGFFAAPSIHAYHQLILLPSLARLAWPMRLLCWVSTFLSLGANYFGPAFWLTGNIFPLLLWFGLRQARRRGSVSYLLTPAAVAV